MMSDLHCFLAIFLPFISINKRHFYPLAASSTHHSLTPPSLINPLLKNSVSSLHLSFVAGKWDFGRGVSRTSEGNAKSLAVWPIHPEVGGGGADLRVWFNDDVEEGGRELADEGKAKAKAERMDKRWTGVTNAMAGLFCSSLGQIDKAMTTSPTSIFSEERRELDSPPPPFPPAPPHIRHY